MLVTVLVALGACTEQTTSPSGNPTVPTVASQSGFALPAQFLSLHMVDELAGWADSGDGILKTSDGGVRWINVTPGWARDQIGAYFFLDAQHAWFAVSDKEGMSDTSITEVGWTSDSGATWHRSHPIQLRWTGYPQFLTFVDPTHGWLLASNGAAAGSQAVDVFATTDGGLTWAETSYGDFNASTPGALPVGCDKLGFTFINSLTGWAVGACNGPGPFFEVTHDGARTWKAQPIVDPENQLGEGVGLGVPHVFQPSNAAVVPTQPMDASGSGSLVYDTTDGGKTWQPRELPSVTAKDGIEIYFASDLDHWWVLGADGIMLERTSDRGLHWVENRTNLPPVDGLTVDFVSAEVGYAAGSFGGHYAGPKLGLYKTVDSGQTWKLVPTIEVKS